MTESDNPVNNKMWGRSQNVVEKQFYRRLMGFPDGRWGMPHRGINRIFARLMGWADPVIAAPGKKVQRSIEMGE